MRVLLIEDDTATAQSIELMLKSEGFNVYTTDLGEEGVDLGGDLTDFFNVSYEYLARKGTFGEQHPERHGVTAHEEGRNPYTSWIATINGTRMDNLRLGAVRFTLTEIGASTVFVMDDTGRITLASSTIPTDQWLKDITGIGLN